METLSSPSLLPGFLHRRGYWERADGFLVLQTMARRARSELTRAMARRDHGAASPPCLFGQSASGLLTAQTRHGLCYSLCCRPSYFDVHLRACLPWRGRAMVSLCYKQSRGEPAMARRASHGACAPWPVLQAVVSRRTLTLYVETRRSRRTSRHDGL
jgi:hypothetical protein